MIEIAKNLLHMCKQARKIDIAMKGDPNSGWPFYKVLRSGTSWSGPEVLKEVIRLLL